MLIAELDACRQAYRGAGGGGRGGVVVTVAATNVPHLLPPALLSSGRLDLHLHVPPPAIEDAVAVAHRIVRTEWMRGPLLHDAVADDARKKETTLLTVPVSPIAISDTVGGMVLSEVSKACAAAAVNQGAAVTGADVRGLMRVLAAELAVECCGPYFDHGGAVARRGVNTAAVNTDEEGPLTWLCRQPVTEPTGALALGVVERAVGRFRPAATEADVRRLNEWRVGASLL